jgi:hypothetical protein
MTLSVSNLTNKQLTDNLITNDYRGMEFKQQCLKELLKRNTFKGKLQWILTSILSKLQ